MVIHHELRHIPIIEIYMFLDVLSELEDIKILSCKQDIVDVPVSELYWNQEILLTIS